MPPNLLEGGFSQQIISSVAYELANIEDTRLNDIADNCFVKTATGDYLDLVGADYGCQGVKMLRLSFIYRFPAHRALS